MYWTVKCKSSGEHFGDPINNSKKVFIPPSVSANPKPGQVTTTTSKPTEQAMMIKS